MKLIKLLHFRLELSYTSLSEPEAFIMPKEVPLFKGDLPEEAFVKAMNSIADFSSPQQFKIKNNTVTEVKSMGNFIKASDIETLKKLIPPGKKEILKQKLETASISKEEYKNLFDALVP
jgi:hypothetical protein